MTYFYAPKMTIETFVNVATRRAFYTIKTDANNNRVTLRFGRLGTLGKSIVKTFSSRDETREFAEKARETRIAHGYVQIAA